MLARNVSAFSVNCNRSPVPHVFAAAMFCILANVYPVLTVIQAGSGQPRTVMGGIVELIASRLYPLALLVFVASVMVPVLKLAGLAVMLMAVMLVTIERGAGCLLKEREALLHRRLDRPLARSSTSSWNRRWARWVQFGAVVSIAPGIAPARRRRPDQRGHFRRRARALPMACFFFWTSTPRLAPRANAGIRI